MQPGTIPLQYGTLYYRQYGDGPQLWIALHGFAQDGQAFAAMAACLPEAVCLLAIDLPWHGESAWPPPEFGLSDFQAAIDYLLKIRNCTTYSAVGFSFGARLLLALAPQEKWRWTHLVLLAPDGLPRGDWYSWVDGLPRVIKRGLSRLLQRPEWIIKLAKSLYQWKILDPLSWRFLEAHLSTPSKRTRAMGIWLSAAAFPRLGQSCRALAVDLDVHLITGEADKIIPFRSFAYLAARLPSATWIRLPGADHNLLSSAVLQQWISVITG